MRDGEVYDPVAYYRDHLREAHERRTSERFESLHRESGVDAEANARIVAEIDALAARIAAVVGRLRALGRLKGVVIFLAVAGLLIAGLLVYLAIAGGRGVDDPLAPWIVGAVAGACALLLVHRMRIAPRLKETAALESGLRGRHAERLEEAWRQMEPLNRLYDWDTATGLCSGTLPTLAFDPYFTRGRLDELVENYAWDQGFNKNRSVLFSRSGSISGNPFVLAETLDFYMESRTYEGTLQISWTERERDSEGRLRTVTRRETLRASVAKPCPGYSRSKFLIYGNEAAPGLHFHRAPSEFSHLGKGWRDRRRLKKEIRRLEKFSRNLDDDSGFTLMANAEFDALFGAANRDNEIHFRILFTPLAQRHMLGLLRDSEVGYGDDFEFRKNKMINIITPRHLEALDLGADPRQFRNYSLVAAREFFNRFNNEYFKSVYFAFAPLMCIPLYQRHRPHYDIYRETYGRDSSFWEHESLANSHGESAFAHPGSVTRSLLKTRVARREANTQAVEVTARGFRSRERVEYVSVRGGDGRSHNVPVKWVEYLPVSRASLMVVHASDAVNSRQFSERYVEGGEGAGLFSGYGATAADARYQRTLISFPVR